MSKKDKSQVNGGSAEMSEVEAEASAAEKLEAFKAKKKEAADRFRENRAKEKAERIEKAKSLIDDLKGLGYWDGLKQEAKEFIEGLANPGMSNNGTSSLLTVLFGANPQVGATFTLEEAFQKTLKGKSNIDHFVKKWAEKGIVVSFTQDHDDIRKSVYRIESLSSVAE